MKKLFCAACAFGFGAVSAFAAVYEFRDRSKDVSYLDASYWQIYFESSTIPATTPPSSGDAVYVTSGNDIEVFVDGSVSENYSYILFKPFSSSSLRFRGREGYVFQMPFSSAGKYLSPAFRINDPDNEQCFFTSGNTSTNAALMFKDADFTMSSDADKNVSVVFEKGSYDFAPDGLAHKDLTLELKRSVDALFAPGTTLRAPKLLLSDSPRLCVSGAVEVVGKTEVSGGRFELFGAEEKKIAETVVSRSGVMLVDNGATVRQTSGILTVDSPSTYASSANSRLIVSNGVYDASGYDANIGTTTDGKVIVDGGSLYVTGGDGVQVGKEGGNGSLELNDGYVKVSRIRLSRGSAAAGEKSLLLVRGGVFEATGDGGVQFQQSCTGNNKGCHEVRLEGGVCKLTRIFRDSTVTAGEAVLSGDGGTLIARKNRDDFISRITKVEFGSKGLTLDTAGYDVGISVPCVNKPDADGLFVKRGEGTLSFSGSEWTVSRTEVRGGTMKFLGDYDTATDMTLTNGAVLSLAGSAKTLSVGSLTIDDAVLELDSGDAVTVDGDLDVRNLRIRWTSLPSGTQPFLAVRGTLSETSRKMLARAWCENAISAGNHANCLLTVDENTGVTTVSFEVAPDAAVSGEARWTGSGAWATAGNWESAKSPSADDVAVFDGTSAGKEVAISAGDTAGALRFEAGDHVFAGDAPLAIAGQGSGAKISVEAGAQTVDVPLELAGVTEVAVSPGAALTLSGEVLYGGLVKTGAGRLTLAGALATYGGLELRDGVTFVSSDRAFGTLALDSVCVRAGTLAFSHPQGREMVFDVPVVQDGQTSDTNVVYRTDTPVTLKEFSHKSGFIVKYGPEPLTIDAPAGKQMYFYALNKNGGTSDTKLVFNEDGSCSIPKGVHPVGIAQGELNFTGGEGSVVSNLGSIRVGVPLASAPDRICPAQLTVDGVDFRGNMGECFYPGFSMNPATHNATSIIRVVNGGVLNVRTVQPGYACTKDKTRVVFALTNGIYRTHVKESYVSRGRLDSTPSKYVIVHYLMNASRTEFSSKVYMDGSVRVDADNGSYFGAMDGKPVTLVWNYANRIYGEMLFRGGSTLAMGDIEEKTGQTRPLTFVFDDGRWVYDEENGDKVWPAPLTEYIRYEMRGRGVVLSPASGKTFRTLARFEGDGGVVNAGEGTIAFGSGTCAFNGVLEIEKPQGAADLSDAGALQSLQVSGAGALVGAEVENLMILHPLNDDWSSAASLPVLRDCTLGRVNIEAGRSESEPVASPIGVEAFPVARIAGSTVFNPGVWRLTGTGAKNIGGKFSLVGDTVYLKPDYRGFQLIVR